MSVDNALKNNGLDRIVVSDDGTTSLAYTFHNCINLKTLTLGDLSKVTNITFAFWSTNVIDEI